MAEFKKPDSFLMVKLVETSTFVGGLYKEDFEFLLTVLSPEDQKKIFLSRDSWKEWKDITKVLDLTLAKYPEPLSVGIQTPPPEKVLSSVPIQAKAAPAKPANVKTPAPTMGPVPGNSTGLAPVVGKVGVSAANQVSAKASVAAENKTPPATVKKVAAAPTKVAEKPKSPKEVTKITTAKSPEKPKVETPKVVTPPPEFIAGEAIFVEKSKKFSTKCKIHPNMKMDLSKDLPIWLRGEQAFFLDSDGEYIELCLEASDLNKRKAVVLPKYQYQKLKKLFGK